VLDLAVVVVAGYTTVVVDPEVVVVGRETIPVDASEKVAVVVRDDDNGVVVEDTAVVVALDRRLGTTVGLDSDAGIKDVILAENARL